MNLFSSAFSYLFFGGKQYANLVLPLSILVVGLVLHALVYAYFRGNLAMRRANTLQLINLGLVPLLAFAVFNGSVRAVLSALGILTTLMAAVALALTPLRHMTDRILPEAKKLLLYGIPRVPGDFIHMALFTLPVTFVAHERGLQEAGFVAFGISVLNMIGSVFTPAGLVLLPKASKMLAEGARSELRTHVVRIATIATVVAIALTVVFELMADPLVRLYLGTGFADVAASIRLMCLGALPFALYCVLRSLVDAYHTKAVNMLNNGIACLAFLLCSGGLLAFHASSLIPVAFLAGIVVLGLLTTREAWKVLAT
jgi:O-antigen/teichoic acid export membrane protein